MRNVFKRDYNIICFKQIGVTSIHRQYSVGFLALRSVTISDFKTLKVKQYEFREEIRFLSIE